MLCIGDKHQFNINAERKRWKKIYYANNNHKRTRVAILISDKIDFKNVTGRGNFHNDKRDGTQYLLNK